MSETNKAVAKRFLEAVGSGDIDTIAALATKDIAVITAGQSSLSGTRGYDTLLLLGATFPKITTTGGLKFRYINLTAEDDRVAVEAKGTSVMLNGKDYNNEYHFLLFIRDGKVYKMMEYLDTKLADDVLAPYFQGIA